MMYAISHVINSVVVYVNKINKTQHKIAKHLYILKQFGFI